jgi:para-aminobenzoate synthetase component 1
MRWVGYLGYDVGGLFENLPRRAIVDLELPLFAFVLCIPATRSPCKRSIPTSHATATWSSTFDRRGYEHAVARAIEYIRGGDVFQVNLSQRLAISGAESPSSIFQRVLSNGGARHGALLDFGDVALVSESPELFFRVTPDRRIITRPIKGTRPLAPGMDIELRNSTKDQAELAMIVDLERNDLGRICQVGSVKVVKPREIEEHPTVYHGVATIEGLLRPEITFVDILAATFPSGSVTGAPKIRAMQIIDELEPVRRGPYCGAIGYIAADGSMEFSVAIRTMVIKDGRAYVPVGGGIVADSDPGAEYEETLVKAKAMLAALGRRS